MALGATPGAVLALVMKEGAALVAAGALAGVAAALVLTRYLATLLYGVTATDPARTRPWSSGWRWPHRRRAFLPARRAAMWIPWSRYVTTSSDVAHAPSKIPPILRL